MRRIERWFQGRPVHGGFRKDWAESGAGPTLCLALACSEQEATQLAGILAQLFPERLCDCAYPVRQLIHFNNHPDTTRDQIDKVMAEWTHQYGHSEPSDV